MTISHALIDDPEIHEPKDVSTAIAGQVYIANGAGSGVWTSPVYGVLEIVGSSTAFTPIAADITQYKKLASVGWSSGESLGVTLNADDITLDGAGVYEVHFWCNLITSAASGTTFAVKYDLDGTLSTQKLKIQKNTAGADILTFSAQGLLSATAGQVLSMYLASSAVTSLIVEDAGFSVVKLK